jgi:hypothetical protein
MADTDNEADDLRSALSSAFDSSVESSEAEALPAPEVETEPEATQSTRARDEFGRFVKTDAEKAAEAQNKPLEAKPAVEGIKPAPEAQNAPTDALKPTAPPPGWSVPAKAEFDKLPQAVKEAIAKREGEVSQGFAKYAAYKGLEPYAEMASRAGTSLPQAVQKWIAAEQQLATDFVSGIHSLCQHFNINPAALGQVLSGQGNGHQRPQVQDPVLSEVAALRNRLAQFEQQQQEQANSGINAEIAAFQAKPENKYFENVKQTMIRLLNAEEASSLQDAYDKACWANPEIRALLISEQVQTKQAETQRKASEARRASGSLSPGAPIPGSGHVSPAKTLRAEIEQSWNSASI